VTVSGIYPGFLEGKLAADNAWDSSKTTSMAAAADTIIAGIKQRKKRLIFPWPLYWKAKLFRTLPLFIQDRAARKLMRADYQS
jgi:short-subunit dehydrogenase